jgi:hypothetical protein
MNRGTVRLILTENGGMKNVCAKMVPKREVCSNLLQQIEENDEWLNTVITGDESWVF